QRTEPVPRRLPEAPTPHGVEAGAPTGCRLRLGQCAEVGLVACAHARTGGAGVVGDQHRTVAAAPGVPGPGEVADSLGLGPGHVGVDEGCGTVVLADLAGDDGDLGGDGRHLGVPAGHVVAGVEVVGVEAGRELVGRVGGAV